MVWDDENIHITGDPHQMNEKKVLYSQDACKKFLLFTSNRADSRDQEWSEGMGGLHNGGRGENERKGEREGGQ